MRYAAYIFSFYIILYTFIFKYIWLNFSYVRNKIVTQYLKKVYLKT